MWRKSLSFQLPTASVRRRVLNWTTPWHVLCLSALFVWGHYPLSTAGGDVAGSQIYLVAVLVSSVALAVAGNDRVLAEALANVRKHSGASTVVVSCSILGDFLALSVTDDGIGLPATDGPDARPGELHFGISNLRTMVERTGGTFSVLSCDDGPGTIVRARIPLSQDLIAAAARGAAGTGASGAGDSAQ